MTVKYSEAELSEIVQMALSDHISFRDINTQYGLGEKVVIKLMRTNLKKGSVSYTHLTLPTKRIV